MKWRRKRCSFCHKKVAIYPQKSQWWASRYTNGGGFVVHDWAKNGIKILCPGVYRHPQENA